MKKRCHNPANKDYVRYGGRGIVVCRRWREDYAAFAADVGPRPSKRHTLDRIDNDGNYEPGNVRWATPEQQWRNRRSQAGEANPKARITQDTASAIRALAAMGNRTLTAIAKELGLSRHIVSDVANGRTWLPSSSQ